MTTLILCTSLSNLLIREILVEHNNQSGDVIILSTNTSANKSLKEIGLPSQFISTSIEQSWTDRDSEFRELCLPGVFGDTKFAGTQLEIYKVLGIDRLNFWYNGINGEQMCHYIESLKWNKLIVSLDLYHHLPLYSMYLAKERGAYCKAVKTHAVLSREFYDIAKLLSCNEIVVETDSELKFLKEKGYWGKVTKRNLKLKELLSQKSLNLNVELIQKDRTNPSKGLFLITCISGINTMVKLVKITWRNTKAKRRRKVI